MAVNVIGAEELNKTLANLAKELTHKEQQRRNIDAAKPLIDKEKLLAPEGPTGNLVDSIGAVRISQRKAVEIGEVHVGPRLRRPYRGHAGHLVEFGTKRRFLKGSGIYKQGTYRGIMPSKPFVRPALTQTRDLVLARMQNATAKQLVARMKRDLGKAFIR